MLFTINRSSDLWHEQDYQKEINTLEDLKQFQRESKHSIIVNFENCNIEIYDAIRE